MKGIVAREDRTSYRIMLFFVAAIGWIDSLHAEVEAQDEIVEVEAQAETVAYGQL